MRKADIINQISEKTGIPKVDVLVTLETLFKEVKESLAQGENIYIRGFGSVDFADGIAGLGIGSDGDRAGIEHDDVGGR